jgi:hypothetical protein
MELCRAVVLVLVLVMQALALVNVAILEIAAWLSRHA